jgi:hypothetical protein
MVTDFTIDLARAKTLEEMQKVARNQIQFAIMELEERAKRLASVLPLVDGVKDSLSHTLAIAEIDLDGDADSLTALHIISENYEELRNGSY